MAAMLRRSMLLLALAALAVVLGRVPIARAATPDLTHRYVVFLDGIAPDTNFLPLITPTVDPKSDFADLVRALGGSALSAGLTHFVYFSYGAAYNLGNDKYCGAWGPNACSPNGSGDLTSLTFDPTYRNDATHISLIEQAKALDWLLGQVVKLSGDKNVKIDIVGYSLGGVVASEWAAKIGNSSAAKANIHAITIIESPVGGIDAAQYLQTNKGQVANPLQATVQHIFGNDVLQELAPGGGSSATSDSIISGLHGATKSFRVTAIESNRDFVVSHEKISFCLGASSYTPCLGYPSDFEVPVGSGAHDQSWTGPNFILIQSDQLGGSDGSAPYNPSFLPDDIGVKNLIYGNHGAPIHDHAATTAGWIICAISADDTAAEKSCDAGSGPPPTGTLPPPQSTTSVTTEFVVDTSGSMSDSAAQGDVAKIDAAKSAVSTLLTFIQQEQQNGEAQQVGLVPFNDQVHDSVAPGNDFGALRNTLNGLQADGSTDIYDALKTAIDQAANTGTAAKKLVILVTDGGQNTPQLGVQDFLDGPVKDAAAKGVTICTIGFGQGSDIDENLLQQIASPDCGYAAAGNEVKLQQQYIKLRAASLGTIAQEFQGTVQQGQTVQLGTVQIGANVGVLNIADVWPGSTLKLHIKDPSGKEIADGSGGVSDGTTPTSENVLVSQPVAGVWTVLLEGVQVAAGGEPYYVLASTRAAANPTQVPAPDPVPPSTSTTAITPTSGGSDAGLIAGTLVGGGIVLGLVLLLATRRRAPTLELIADTGARVPLRPGTLTLGRDSACSVRFSDSAVSGRHAQIVVDSSGVTIFDLGSRFGTFVNGRQIRQSPLVAGDRLRLGNSDLVVWDARNG